MCVCVCVCVSMFVLLTIAPVWVVSVWKKYGNFSNSFHLDVLRLQRRLERINHKIK